MAKESTLIGAIGDWVLREACRQLRAGWIRDGGVAHWAPDATRG